MFALVKRYVSRPELRPIVAVPARNEADRLQPLLQAFARQTWLTKPGRRLDIVLVLNNCNDGSGEVAEAVGSLYPALRLDVIDIDLPDQQAHVGWARRLAMNRAYARSGAAGVLLSTDADALPASNWVDATLNAITAGADLVGGHISGNKIEERKLGAAFVRRAARQLEYQKLTDRLASLMLPSRHDPWPRHSDHTAASLAVRSNVYAALGGIPPLCVREDVTFVSKAVAAGYRLRHPPDVNVCVSARLDGRASGGMAECLRGWLAAEAAGDPHLVEAPELIFARFSAELRKKSHFFLPGALAGMASDTDISMALTRMRQIIGNYQDAIHVA